MVVEARLRAVVRRRQVDAEHDRAALDGLRERRVAVRALGASLRLVGAAAAARGAGAGIGAPLSCSENR